MEALSDEVKRALDSVSHANEEAVQRSIAERNTRFREAEVARRKRSSADFADGTQSIYLVDMGGDGLTDLVRIRNGEVCFGAKVTMDQSPRSTTKLTTKTKRGILQRHSVSPD